MAPINDKQQTIKNRVCLSSDGLDDNQIIILWLNCMKRENASSNAWDLHFNHPLIVSAQWSVVQIELEQIEGEENDLRRSAHSM